VEFTLLIPAPSASEHVLVTPCYCICGFQFPVATLRLSALPAGQDLHAPGATVFYPSPRPLFLAPDEIRKLLEHSHDDAYVIIATAILTGMRRGELFALQAGRRIQQRPDPCAESTVLPTRETLGQDVWLCFHETQEQGKRPPDRHVASIEEDPERTLAGSGQGEEPLASRIS
jgi:hypothetical protein